MVHSSTWGACALVILIALLGAAVGLDCAETACAGACVSEGSSIVQTPGSPQRGRSGAVIQARSLSETLTAGAGTVERPDAHAPSPLAVLETLALRI